MKASYHPAVTTAFYLNCLPKEMLRQIPRATRSEWKHKNSEQMFGYDWYQNNLQIFEVLQKVSNYQKLLKEHIALMRVAAIKKFLQKYEEQIKAKISNASQTALANIIKVTKVLGLNRTLRLLHMSYSEYVSLRRTTCRQSPLNKCIVKHPVQLLKKEADVIKRYCRDERYSLWSLSSVYHQIKKDGAAYFSIATFYKYAGLLNLHRVKAKHRRKHHTIGIRADRPLQVLHADTTIFRLQNNTKVYIYFIQDNFSRNILSYRIALEYSANYVFENLKFVHENYLIPNKITDCRLVTDDGCENFGKAKKYCNANAIEHIIAQKDIVQSNSMIEAANKQIKYRFLYHQHITTFEELVHYIKLAVEDYNNRPHDVLNGLTPVEVLNGKLPAQVSFHKQIKRATRHRISENKKAACCILDCVVLKKRYKINKIKITNLDRRMDIHSSVFCFISFHY